MQVKYMLNDQSHQFDVDDSEDLAVMCPEIEGRIRGDHPEFASRPFLTEKVADALLNSLADDAQVVDLGDLSAWNKLCLSRTSSSTCTSCLNTWGLFFPTGTRYICLSRSRACCSTTPRR